jgi:hypothetical protein
LHQICDRLPHPTIISIIGNLFLIVAFTFIGPAPFFANLKPSVELAYGMGAVIGSGYGLVLISSFTRVYKAAMARGYEDTVNTYLIKSGIITEFAPQCNVTISLVESGRAQTADQAARVLIYFQEPCVWGHRVPVFGTWAASVVRY